MRTLVEHRGALLAVGRAALTSVPSQIQPPRHTSGPTLVCTGGETGMAAWKLEGAPLTMVRWQSHWTNNHKKEAVQWLEGESHGAHLKPDFFSLMIKSPAPDCPQPLLFLSLFQADDRNLPYITDATPTDALQRQFYRKHLNTVQADGPRWSRLQGMKQAQQRAWWTCPDSHMVQPKKPGRALGKNSTPTSPLPRTPALPWDQLLPWWTPCTLPQPPWSSHSTSGCAASCWHICHCHSVINPLEDRGHTFLILVSPQALYRAGMQKPLAEMTTKFTPPWNT